MGRVYKYPYDLDVSDKDIILGSDIENGLKTKNFKMLDIKNYILKDVSDIIPSGFTSQPYATWTGVGLIFDVVYPSYYIEGVFYSGKTEQITLIAADPTNPRLDIIAVDVNGTIQINGAPSSQPVEPLIDVDTQLKITTVLVNANATIPSNIVEEVVYKENVEWTATSNIPSINFNSADAYQGNKCIKLNAISNNNYILFTDSTTNQIANYDILKFFIRLEAKFITTNKILINFYNGASKTATLVVSKGKYNFQPTIVNSYQCINIPLSDFIFSSVDFNKVEISYVGDTINNAIWIDNIALLTTETSVEATQNAITSIITDSGTASSTVANDSITFTSPNSGLTISALGKIITFTSLFTSTLKTLYDNTASSLTALLATGSRLITLTEITKLSNTSGTNTGDQNLSAYAPLASPAFTGIPTAPTATSGTSTTQIASTAFVATAVSNSSSAGQTENFNWRFDTATTATNPTGGRFKMNSTTPSLVTELYVNDICDSSGLDISNIFASITGNYAIYIQETGDATKFIQFTTSTAYTDNGGWWTIPVTYVQHGASGILDNSAKCTWYLINKNGAATGGMTLNTAQTVTGAKSFRDNTLIIDPNNIGIEKSVLSARTGMSIPFPVPYLTPTTNDTPIAFDIFPKGNASNAYSGSADLGVAWVDICSTDIVADGVNYEALRMGVFKNGYANITTAKGGTGVLRPLILQINGAPVQIGINTSPTPTNVPSILSLGSTYSNTPGFYPKLKIYDDGSTVYGIGASATQMEFLNPSSKDFAFYVNGALKAKITSTGDFSAKNITVNGTLGLRNIADTFTSYFSNANTASRTYTLQNRNGTLLDDTDLSTINSSLATKQSVFTGTANYITKSLNATTLIISRLFDDGTYLGVGTVNTPIKDLTFGYQSNREIGVEFSDSSTIGRDLTITAGKTVNYSLSTNFNSLGIPITNGRDMCAGIGNDLYIATYGNLYKQTGGSGGVSSVFSGYNFNAVGVDNVSGSVYVGLSGGTIYKQTNGTGSFVDLVQTSRTWRAIRVHQNGNVYATADDGVFMQTSGTGNFNVISGLSGVARYGLAIDPINGDVYINDVSSLNLFKQSGGSGSFNLVSANTSDRHMSFTPTGDLIVFKETNLYKRIYGGSTFSVISGISGSIFSVAVTANTNVYACDYYIVDLFMQNNVSLGTSNLQGGTLKLKAGTGKGTGQSRIQFVTGAKTASGTNMQTETVRAEIDEQGIFKLASISTYADNTTALAGGLVAGQFYRTAIGTLMIVY